MELRVGDIVKYDGIVGEIQIINGNGYIQIKYHNGFEYRVRLVKADLLEKVESVDSKPKNYSLPRNPIIFNGGSGSISNSIIRSRNRGVRHQFEDSIGGCSSNYR